MLWRGELLRFDDSVGMHHTDAAQSSPAREGSASDEANANELASASDPSRNARAELASITGTLKVAQEDLPLGGFPITIEGGPTARTDSFGAFEFQGLAPGPARLVVTPIEPFEPLERDVELLPGLNRVELRLVPRFELAVVVVEQASRPGASSQPISGVSVHLEDAFEFAAFLQHEPKIIAAAGVTDANGHCVLSAIPAGDFALVARAEGRIPSRVPVACWYADEKERAAPRSISMAMSASSSVLRGRVRGPGRQPQAGALVCLEVSPDKKRTFARVVAGITPPSPPFTLTDADGAFELPLPDGAFEVALIVCASDPHLSPIARRVVSHEDLEREVAIELKAARPIGLVVHASDGRVVEGQLKVSDGELAYDRVSDHVLALLPGFSEFFGLADDVEGAIPTFALPDGGYEVRLETGSRVLGSWFIQVDASTPDAIELRLPE